MTALARSRMRARVRVRGTVQGVGFRPFVYRLAREQQLAGYVLNDEHGVLIEIEGTPDSVGRFLSRLRLEAPPLALVDGVESEPVEVLGEATFAIRHSAGRGEPDALVSADSATCPDCLAELRDPANRRFRYPFTNCTNCGPRFTIVRGVPYDRELTTMAGFRMCHLCQAEYDDPGDRRFHAQPNACPRCGPRVRLVGADGRGAPARQAGDAIDGAARHLAAGAILAIKGLGGYHLACDAGDELAVTALRERKHREDKPFALMVADLDAAAGLVRLGALECELLSTVARPIVLAPRRPEASVAGAVAPGAPELGVMLPYAPLHHLVLADFATHAGGRGALVMTSGNVSDEPIAYRDEDALEQLAEIADLFLVHDRPIETRTDDSVLRVLRAGAERRPMMLRRSRGYVPGVLGLPVAAPRPLLACGAEQKNTFCVAKGARAWVGHHIGDLEHYATLTAFQTGVEHFERLFAVTPRVVAHDMHPGYLSTTYALEREDVELVAVQHHHAHLAACLAEHGVTGPAVGAIFDGTGYGTDATVWGGELLIGDLLAFERAGRLRPVRLPGAAAAIREPWRMAFAWLAEAFGAPQPLPARLAPAVDETLWERLAPVARSDEVSPVCTSLGRLCDAVAALCGICPRVSYEGQAAIELEAAAARAPDRGGAYEIDLTAELEFDPRRMVRAIAGDLAAGVHVGAIAAGFHAALVSVTVRACTIAAGRRNLETVVLSGGVFQNRLLLEGVSDALLADGLRVLTPERLPPNDGGISYGQAAIAAALDAAGRV